MSWSRWRAHIGHALGRERAFRVVGINKRTVTVLVIVRFRWWTYLIPGYRAQKQIQWTKDLMRSLPPPYVFCGVVTEDSRKGGR